MFGKKRKENTRQLVNATEEFKGSVDRLVKPWIAAMVNHFINESFPRILIADDRKADANSALADFLASMDADFLQLKTELRVSLHESRMRYLEVGFFDPALSAQDQVDVEGPVSRSALSYPSRFSLQPLSQFEKGAGTEGRSDDHHRIDEAAGVPLPHRAGLVQGAKPRRVDTLARGDPRGRREDVLLPLPHIGAERDHRRPRGRSVRLPVRQRLRHDQDCSEMEA